MPMFLLFVSAGVLFDGVFSLWVSLSIETIIKTLFLISYFDLSKKQNVTFTRLEQPWIFLSRFHHLLFAALPHLNLSKCHQTLPHFNLNFPKIHQSENSCLQCGWPSVLAFCILILELSPIIVFWHLYSRNCCGNNVHGIFHFNFQVNYFHVI